MIEKLLNAASDCNLVHFPQGLTIRRNDGGGWGVTILGKDGPSTIPHASGKSPEDAIENLRKAILSLLREGEASAGREAARKADAAKQLESAQ